MPARDDRFLVAGFEPAYLALHRDGRLRARAELAHAALVMPGLAAESAAILDWLARELSPDTYVSVMAQYRPAWRVGEPDGSARSFAEIDRTPRAAEIDTVYEVAREAGLWRFDQRRATAYP